MDQTIQLLFKSHRVNKKKMQSVLNRELDPQKRDVFDNMKHEFMAHLSDRQSELNERHRKAVNAVRQRFQSLLMQIPSNVQNLTLGDIERKGGSIAVTEGPQDDKQITVHIPKSLTSSASNLPQMKPPKSRNDILKETMHKTAAMRSASNRKTTEQANSSRVMTRSAMKTTVRREVITREKVVNTKTETVPNPSSIANCPTVSPRKATLLKEIGICKKPRNPIDNEDMVTLAFSTKGTPLAVDQKALQRMNKN